jgi:ABC-2 type transport system permease protein
MSATDVTASPQGAIEDDAIRRAISSSPRPPRPSALANVMTFGWRGMLKIKHVPEQLFDVTLTPVMFMLMFTYLFGGEVAGSTGDYLQYILPGLLVMGVLFTTVYSGIALNTDLTKGVVDRFRSLPIWRASPLAGAVVGDSVRYVIASIVTVGLGLILGFDAEGGLLGIAAGIGLVVVFAFALSWAFTTLGLVLRTPNAVMNVGFTAIFPLTFLSNTFVDPETLPGALEAFVDVNPISHLVTATRGLIAGSPDGGEVAIVLGTALVLVAIFAPLTSRLYRTR